MTTTTTTTAPVATSTITILRTSQRGAHLITDGTTVAWVMGRNLRADGSWTPSTYTALAEGKPYADWQKEEADRELWRTDREAAREKAFQDGKLPTTIDLPLVCVTDYSAKAWKVRTLRTQVLYGKVCSVYEYLPKSIVSVAFEDGKARLTMPKWFLSKNGWLNDLVLD